MLASQCLLLRDTYPKILATSMLQASATEAYSSKLLSAGVVTAQSMSTVWDRTGDALL